MVRIKDLMTAINKKIADAFPYTVYVNRCPKDFVRPSFWIQYVTTSRRDVNRSTVAKTAYFTITCFTQVDEHYEADQEELIELQEEIIQLFSDGFVAVDDRAIKVQSSTGGVDFDRAYIDLQFEYFDDRNNEADETPLMLTITTNLKEV